jgi:hypothetical protein
MSALLDQVRGSETTSKLTGYLIHSHQYGSSKPTQKFWDLQANFVKQLHITRALLIIVVFVHPDHDGQADSTAFIQELGSDGWLIIVTSISYPDYGISVTCFCWLIAAIHSNTEPSCKVIDFWTPPSIPSWPLAQFIWAPFNWPEHTIS